MDVIQSELRAIETPERTMYLRYELFAEDRGGTRYGVRITDVFSGERQTVGDLTSIQKRAEEFYQRILSGQATPVSLRELCEDFVAEPIF